jgi:hypothetical protein
VRADPKVGLLSTKREKVPLGTEIGETAAVKGLQEKMRAGDGATLGTRTEISTGKKIGNASEERSAIGSEKETGRKSVKKSVIRNVKKSVIRNVRRNVIRSVRRKGNGRKISREKETVTATATIIGSQGIAPIASDF